MPRTPPGSRAYALENAAFLRHLRRTGNAHEAARALDAARSRFTRRRARDPAFAARWDAALALAHATLRPLATLSAHAAPGSLQRPPAPGAPRRPGMNPPHATPTASGRFQIRRRPTTAITPAAEQAFLAALAATANVRLAAQAAGFAHSSFYTRKRTHPAFAREWRLALAHGFERVEMALLASWREDSAEHDSWRYNDPPAVPPMTGNQALQLMYLHQKEVLGRTEPRHTRRRRREPDVVYNTRLAAMHEAGLERAREQFRIAEAIRAADRAAASPHEPPPPPLPDLAQVTGWSKADPAKTPHHEGVALFGGWRIGDWKGG